ncbi:MAG TPA: hypothetical protein VFN67_23190 [Polyangiales bacterium]|nr:hypothetical protein [Polyangiales bacterium]
MSLAVVAMTCVVQAQAVELEWRAPRECPDRQAVLDALHQSGPAVALRARAQITKVGAKYHLQLELESRSGRAHRTLSQSQCTGLAEAAAVLIALALETDASSPTPQPEAPAQPEPQAQPQPPTRLEAPPQSKATPAASPPSAATSAASSDTDLSEVAGLPQTPADPADAEWHWQLSASARADLGTFPQQPALGVQAQLAARFARLFVALGASYWLPREQISASYPGARLSGSGVFADLSLGIDATKQPISLTPQLNVELGRLDAEARGIAGPERNSTLWIALGPCVSVAVNVLNDWTVGFELGGLVTAYRAHWLVRTPTADVPAFVSSSLVLRLGFRIGYALR